MRENSITSKIENIMNKNIGKIYSIKDFYYLANMNSVKSSLSRLEMNQKIVRLIDGLYYKPYYSKLLKKNTTPSAVELANKLAEKFAWTIFPADETALNMTGLSTQISNIYVYKSDGEYKKYKYEDKEIIFKKTANKNIKNFSFEFLALIESIKKLGKDKITIDKIRILKNFCTKNKLKFGDNLKFLPYWIIDILIKIKNYKK